MLGTLLAAGDADNKRRRYARGIPSLGQRHALSAAHSGCLMADWAVTVALMSFIGDKQQKPEEKRLMVENSTILYDNLEARKALLEALGACRRLL